MATQAGWERPSTTSARYTRVAIFLHWAIAACVLYNLTSGLLRPVLPRGFFVFHVSSGITILALSVARVVWRLTHRPPPMLPMARWEKGLAHAVHFLLYAAILIVPFTGWAMVSASPPPGSPGAAYAAAERARHDAASGRPARPQRARGPILLWGLAPLPMLEPWQEPGRAPAGVAAQQETHEQLEQVHGSLALVLLFLLVLHVGGALKHQFLDRLPELARMGVGAESRKRWEV